VSPGLITVPDGLALATNHTWLRSNRDGTVTIGLDEFLSRVIGAVEKVTLPSEGDIVAPAVAEISLGVRGHSLHLSSPMRGNVVETNLDLLKDPSLIHKDPYGMGWLVRLKAREDDGDAWGKYTVRKPLEWLKDQASLVRDFLVMNSQQGEPVTMQEGGLPMDGVLQNFNEGVWRDFGRTFATLHRTTENKENRI
jgi:glycine cleavage system H protein